jgi:hypothetical protein
VRRGPLWVSLPAYQQWAPSLTLVLCCYRDGYDRNGLHKDGYDRYGFDKYGFDRSGFNKDSYDRCARVLCVCWRGRGEACCLQVPHLRSCERFCY